MPITMYAYNAADSDESDPDELFVVTTDDPAAVLREQFPANATYEFLYSDEHTNEWVFDAWDGDRRIASLYTSEACRCDAHNQLRHGALLMSSHDDLLAP